MLVCTFCFVVFCFLCCCLLLPVLLFTASCFVVCVSSLYTQEHVYLRLSISYILRFSLHPLFFAFCFSLPPSLLLSLLPSSLSPSLSSSLPPSLLSLSLSVSLSLHPRLQSGWNGAVARAATWLCGAVWRQGPADREDEGYGPHAAASTRLTHPTDDRHHRICLLHRLEWPGRNLKTVSHMISLECSSISHIWSERVLKKGKTLR